MTDARTKTVLGLDGFNIVIVGDGFPVEKVNADEFVFGGHRLQTTLKLPQILQGQVDKYTLQVLPNRFEVAASQTSPSSQYIGALIETAEFFVEQFVAKRSISAVGHNVLGEFPSAMGSASEFMRFLAWPDKFAKILPSSGEATQSVLTKFAVDDFRVAQVRLEPSVANPDKVFYDINVSWNEFESMTVVDAIRQLPDSVQLASDLVSSLSEMQ